MGIGISSVFYDVSSVFSMLFAGPCMAGIVGTILPRYGVFGETLDIAFIMKSSCHRKINILSGNSNSIHTRSCWFHKFYHRILCIHLLKLSIM